MFTAKEVLNKHYPTLQQSPALFKPAQFVLKKLLHEDDVVEFAHQYGHLTGLDFVEQVLEYFSISTSARDNEKERIPTRGECIVIANHPIGSLDALALIKQVMEVRKDLKVVANEMLMTLKPMHDLLLPVNNMQGNTPKQNLKNIHQHLKKEGIVLIFPAGEVSRLRPQGVRDTRWHTVFLRIAKQTNSPILPIFIDAKNSPTFYSVSMLFKPLSTALLVEEMFKQKSNVIGLRIGEVIPVESFLPLKLDLNDLTKLFKKHIYRIWADKKGLFQTQRAIALAEDRRTLKGEIENLCELLGKTSDGKLIFLYRHEGSTAIMREIGRLREIAFRAVGKGTNRRRDIDTFDNAYFHLILWDDKALEIAGAYRFGDAKTLSQTEHETGLYSATLFDYKPQMTQYFEQGLELGRSFVQPKYWGKRSLDYLWFGIGAFVQRYPNYRYLFGPVSIPGTFPQSAIKLLVDFYSCHFNHHGMLASPKLPVEFDVQPPCKFDKGNYKEDFVNLKALLGHMNLKVPTLFKQYSEVAQPEGVSFLAFNSDPDFNDCVDGLVMVDIEKLKPKKRARYLSDNQNIA